MAKKAATAKKTGPKPAAKKGTSPAAKGGVAKAKTKTTTSAKESKKAKASSTGASKKSAARSSSARATKGGATKGAKGALRKLIEKVVDRVSGKPPKAAPSTGASTSRGKGGPTATDKSQRKSERARPARPVESKAKPAKASTRGGAPAEAVKSPKTERPAAKASAAASATGSAAGSTAPKQTPARKVSAPKPAPGDGAPATSEAVASPTPKPAGKVAVAVPVAPEKKAAVAPVALAPIKVKEGEVVRPTLPPGYKPSPDEPYMNPLQLEYFRQKLLRWRDELVEESKQTIDNLREEVRDVGDDAERATRETENSLELRTRDRYRKLLAKIDKALKRIDDGEYGYCEETGEEIGLERLEARPIATLCLDAQERWEIRQRQMGD
jgi:DnaK suppressor protein